MTKAELARQLGVSRTYVTLLFQGKKKPGRKMVDRLAALGLTANLNANQAMHEHTTFHRGVTGSRAISPSKALGSYLRSPGTVILRRLGKSSRCLSSGDKIRLESGFFLTPVIKTGVFRL